MNNYTESNVNYPIAVQGIDIFTQVNKDTKDLEIIGTLEVGTKAYYGTKKVSLEELLKDYQIS